MNLKNITPRRMRRMRPKSATVPAPLCRGFAAQGLRLLFHVSPKTRRMGGTKKQQDS